MKAYEFLSQYKGHDIRPADDFNEEFTRETDLRPCWPCPTVKETRAAIDSRGLGGICEGNDEDKTVWLYIVADSLAIKYCNYSSPLHGRGSRFRDNIRVLKENNI